MKAWPVPGWTVIVQSLPMPCSFCSSALAAAARPRARTARAGLSGPVHRGVTRELAVIQIRRKGHKALCRQPVGHLLDPGVESPPLLHDDDTRARPLGGCDQVARRRPTIAR